MTNDERVTYIAGAAVGAAIVAGALILIEARRHPCDCHEHGAGDVEHQGDELAGVDVEHERSSVSEGGLPLGVVANGARAMTLPPPTNGAGE